MRGPAAREEGTEIRSRVLVIGGGVAGLGAALGLARSGNEVVLADRDPLTAAADPDQAFAVERRGAPQVRHTHGLLARLTLTLREHFPDVLDTLVAAGGVEVDLAHRFSKAGEGDEHLRVLLARRTTLEWALRLAAASQPGLTLRGGTGVAGLIGDRGSVNGVQLDTGELVRADAVVAAGGRRSDLAKWLAPLGASVSEEEHDTGIVYLTRWYRAAGAWDRVIDGEELVKLGGDLGYLFYLAVPADRGTFSLTMAIGADDGVLRSQLTNQSSFEKAAAALPLPPGLLDRLEPDGPVHPMGGLVNRVRRFLGEDARPVVTGFHAAGDAHTCTNPIYGRGCSLALVQAVALTDAFGRHPDDPVARAVAYESACAEHTEPWYHLSVQADAARLDRARALRDGREHPPGPIDRLFELGSDDPVLGRAILRVVNLLATPQQLMSDPEVVSRAMQLASDTAGQTPVNRWAREGLSRQQLLDLTAA